MPLRPRLSTQRIAGRLSAGFVRIHLLTAVMVTLLAGALLGNALHRKSVSSYNFGFNRESLPLTEKNKVILTVEHTVIDKFGWSHLFAERTTEYRYNLEFIYDPATKLGADLRWMSQSGSSNWFDSAGLKKEVPVFADVVLRAEPMNAFTQPIIWKKDPLTYFLCISGIGIISLAILSEVWIRNRSQGKSSKSVSSS